jgi:hypothetical protein
VEVVEGTDECSTDSNEDEPETVEPDDDGDEDVSTVDGPVSVETTDTADEPTGVVEITDKVDGPTGVDDEVTVEGGGGVLLTVPEPPWIVKFALISPESPNTTSYYVNNGIHENKNKVSRLTTDNIVISQRVIWHRDSCLSLYHRDFRS